MPSMNLLVVGEEKSLPEFEDALESCKRYVGPIKLFTAHKAVDAVSRLQKLIQTCGHCHAAFLSHHFTCPGKEEFSETLRKVIKEKYPDVPVICWGNPKKGGETNKHFHATLDFVKGAGDVNALVDILKQVQAGQIRPDYLHKDQRKSVERRNSLDRSESLRGGLGGRMDSLLRRTDSQRRSSQEMPRPGPPDRTLSSRRSAEEELQPAGGLGGMPGATPTLRRKSVEQYGGVGGLPSPAAAAPGMGGMGPMGLTHMHSMGPMAGSMAAMGGLSASPSGHLGAGLGALGGMPGGMVGGFGASSMNAHMAMGVGMGGGMGMGAVAAPMGGVMPGMGHGMGDVMGGMAMGVGGMGMGMGMAAVPAVLAPVAPAAAAPAAPANGSNAELIKMLAEEVVRLRKAVEDKRAREAAAAAAAQQHHPQQQHQLPMGAGGVVSVGGGMMGGGMPLGI